MSIEIPVVSDAEHRRCLCGGEPMIFHCHHYNAFLQRTIRDADYIDTISILTGAGCEAAHSQLVKIFKEQGLREVDARKSFAQELYRWAGFGTLNFSSLTEKGGAVKTPNSHYSVAYSVKSWKSKEPVCFFSSGWLAGALAAIYDKPTGAYSVQHTKCIAMGNPECIFELKEGAPNYSIYPGAGMGPLTAHNVRPIPTNNVDYDGIFKAVSGMPLVGNDDGYIYAFGVYLTRHYANYYNRISFEFERALEKKFGKQGVEVAAPLLTEAGHVCAFNTLGGIMVSTEWDALIRPSLKTKEDWVHGIIAVVNTLGWGRWQVTKVSETMAEFVAHDDYESVGYLAMYGKSDHPISYLFQGGVVGIMDLVYAGDIASKPRLTQDFYDKLFRQSQSYVAQSLSSRAMGDEVTSFRVRKV
ncbi:MAG: hypothetical protein HY548_04535 [Elusimicrobia bacterium]|nr:hypothetical protein [Elusimicrobiota bacterium]